MPQLKKLLFPVDFSSSCVGAARHVNFFASHFAAETMLLHAVGTRERPASGREVAAAQKKLKHFLADELPNLTAQLMCVAGDAATAIVEAGDSWHPDLVMMPTRGRGDYRRHLLGSVTAKVLHDLSCPIWTSIHAETVPAVEALACRRILCAVDLTEHSFPILEWAIWLAGEYRASLGVVHAMAALQSLLVPKHLDPALGDLGSAYERYVREHTEKELSALRAKVDPSAEVFIEPGSPVSVVPNIAVRFEADLVIIGGERPKPLLMMCSMTFLLLYATCHARSLAFENAGVRSHGHRVRN
jgi:nucleotide-binding universal stress UspA family protein